MGISELWNAAGRAIKEPAQSNKFLFPLNMMIRETTPDTNGDLYSRIRNRLQFGSVRSFFSLHFAPLRSATAASDQAMDSSRSNSNRLIRSSTSQVFLAVSDCTLLEQRPSTLLHISCSITNCSDGWFDRYRLASAIRVTTARSSNRPVQLAESKSLMTVAN